MARGPPACFAQPRAASAKLAPIQAASQDSCASARTSCVGRGRKRLRRAKLRGPRATCMLRPAPSRLSQARPYTSSFARQQGKAVAQALTDFARQQGKAVAQALTDSFLHEARPCKPCRKRKTAQGKASWPAGHLRASHSPGPPQLSSPLYRQPT